MEIINELQSLQDLKYRDFQAKLIPTIDQSTIIGVRMPDLRKLAKKNRRKTFANFHGRFATHLLRRKYASFYFDF